MQSSRIWFRSIFGALLLLAAGASAQTVPVPSGASASERLAEADQLFESARRLRRDGQAAEAETALKRALELRRAVLGSEDPSVARVVDALGSTYYNRGQFAEAEALYREALAVMEKALGPRNLEVADVLGNLGAALREGRKFAESEQIVRRSMSLRALLLSNEHPSVGSSLDNLGRNYLMQGRYADAAQAFGESVRILRQALGPDHPRVRDGSQLLQIVERRRAAPAPTEVPVTGPDANVAFKLNSGATVSIAAFGPFVSPEGWAGLVLIYRTALSFDDVAALRREADEIWQHLVVDVLKARYERALVIARPQAGDSARAINFHFAAREGGWRTSELRPRVLDEGLVREVIARFDYLVETRNNLAAALYLAQGWTGRIRRDGQTVELTREAFVGALLSMPADYAHEREIVSISIDAEGRTATIESREVESFEQAGSRLRTVSRSIDVLTLVDDHVEFTNSTVDVTSEARPL